MTPPEGRADRVELRGLRVTAVHGVLESERRQGQPFELDLDLELDLATAGASDSLDDTVDYGAVAEAAAAVIAGPPANLLEHLATRVADAVFTAGGRRLRAVTVTVRKLRPPVGAELASAGVTITRTSPDGEPGR